MKFVKILLCENFLLYTVHTQRMMHVEHPKDTMHGVKMVVSATLVLCREIIVFGRFEVYVCSHRMDLFGP